MKKTILILSMGLFSSALLANAHLGENVPEVIEASERIDGLKVNSFCKAIIQGDLDLVRKMISLGEDVNQKSLGKTPAHYAARYNKPQILELLIQNGANLKKRCDQGYTVKKYAEVAHAKEALEVINAAMKK